MATTTIGKLNVILSAQTGKFSRDMKGANKSVGLLSSGVVKLGGVLAAAFSARSLFNGLKESIRLFGIQEQASRRMAEGLKLAGDSSASTLKDFERFASSIQAVTTIGDEAVLDVAALGAALGRMSGQQLKDATRASIGLAKAAGIDAASAMKLLSRAALGGQVDFARYGIIVDKTKSKQDQFNQVLKIGAEGFALAAAEADTTAGRIQQLSNTIGDLKENIGGLAAGPLKSFAEDLNSVIKPGGSGGKIALLEGYAVAMSQLAGSPLLARGLGLDVVAAEMRGASGILRQVEAKRISNDLKYSQTQERTAAAEAARSASKNAAAFSGRVSMLKMLGFDTTGLRMDGGDIAGQLDKSLIGGPLIGMLQSMSRGPLANPVSSLTDRLMSQFKTPTQAAGSQFTGAFERGSTAEYSARLAAMGNRPSDNDRKVERNTGDTAKGVNRLADMIERYGLSQQEAVVVSF